MSNDVNRLIAQLRTTSDVAPIDAILSELADCGEEGIRAAMLYAEDTVWSSLVRRRMLVMLKRIGTPANLIAIPFIVDQVSDANGPQWEAALDLLACIGAPLLPEMRTWLESYAADWDSLHADPTGALELFVALHASGRLVAIEVLPKLLDGLAHATANTVDQLLLPISLAGSPHADAVLPLLFERIAATRWTWARQQFIQALAGFERNLLVPYRDGLSGCLTDLSHGVRAAAESTLSRLDGS